MGEEKLVSGMDTRNTAASARRAGDGPDRIAVVGIIIEDLELAGAVNEILHQYNRYIIGRMGLPYREKQVSIISVVLDAPSDVISAVSGKLGRLPGVSSKALYSRQKDAQAVSAKEYAADPGKKNT